MEPSRNFEFWKLRRPTDVIGDGVYFLRLNFRQLGRSLLYISGPLVVLLLLLQWATLSGSDLLLEADQKLGQVLIIHGGRYFALLVTVGVLNEYVKLYTEHGADGFDVTDVWRELREDLGKIVFISLAILLVIGFVAFFLIMPGMFTIGALFVFLLVLPAIYLSVVFSILMTVLIVEDLDVMQAFSRCFELVKGYWWPTLGVLLGAGLLSALLNTLFTIPTWVVMGIQDLSTLDDPEAIASGFPYKLAAAVSWLGYFCVSMIPAAASVLQYFNLVERRDGVGILRRIDEIGTDRNEERSELYQW